MNIIKIKTKINPSDYVKFTFMTTYSKFSFVIVTMVGVAFLGITFAYFLGYEGLVSYPPYFHGIFGLFVVFGIPYSIYKKAKKQIDSNKSLHEELTYEFSNNGVNINGETVKASYPWSKLYRIKRMKNWLLLYQSKTIANFISLNNVEPDLYLELTNLIKSQNLKIKIKM